MLETFNIFLINAAEAEKIMNSIIEPHQHDFEELIIGVKGRLQHDIDCKTTTLEAPLISFVTKGKTHRAIPMPVDGECNMWVLRFKSEFIAEITFQLYDYYHDYANQKFDCGNAFDRMVTICDIIHTEMNEENTNLSVVRHLLSALFNMIKSEVNKMLPKKDMLQSTQNTTLKSFLRILEDNYHRSVGVDFYAEKLFMSSRNLNLICKNTLQQTVSEIIETRKLVEAKNQLTHTDKNISDIGFDLGYNEKSYFTNVFKRRTGQTPSEFREEMKSLFS